MKSKVTKVEEIEGFDGCGERVRVFKCTEPLPGNERFNQTVHVWHGADSTRCTECSGPRTAMLQNCYHCRAVKKFLESKREK